MWPRPPKAASIVLVRSRISAGGAYSQPGSRLPCSATGCRASRRRASAASVCQSTPMTSAPVARAISSSAHPAPGAKAMTGAPAASAMRTASARYGSANSRKSRGPERAGPRVEQLDRLRARGHLRLEERAHRPRQPLEQRVRPRRVLHQQPLRLGERLRPPPFHHVAHQRPRRAGEPDERHPPVELAPRQPERVEDVAQVAARATRSRRRSKSPARGAGDGTAVRRPRPPRAPCPWPAGRPGCR